MTIEEFNATGWGPQMTGVHRGTRYAIISCDFEEKLIGILGMVANEPEAVSWVRCENVTAIERKGERI